jgi:hypothetical protein
MTCTRHGTVWHARIVSPPEWKLRKLLEFTASDFDGNLIRLFYDFRETYAPNVR